MSIVEEDAPRLAEIGRMLADFRHEFRQALDGLLRKDVYQAEKAVLATEAAALRDRVRRLEDDRRWLSRTVVGATVTSAGSLVTALVVLLVR